jgi:hypothetical protein
MLAAWPAWRADRGGSACGAAAGSPGRGRIHVLRALLTKRQQPLLAFGLVAWQVEAQQPALLAEADHQPDRQAQLAGAGVAFVVVE